MNTHWCMCTLLYQYYWCMCTVLCQYYWCMCTVLYQYYWCMCTVLYQYYWWLQAISILCYINTTAVWVLCYINTTGVCIWATEDINIDPRIYTTYCKHTCNRRAYLPGYSYINVQCHLIISTTYLCHEKGMYWSSSGIYQDKQKLIVVTGHLSGQKRLNGHHQLFIKQKGMQ